MWVSTRDLLKIFWEPDGVRLSYSSLRVNDIAYSLDERNFQLYRRLAISKD